MTARLLIIDDDEELCEEISEMLLAEGYDTDITTSGGDGLARLKSGEYSLLILDLVMPGTNGRDILNWLRVNRPEMKSLIITGSPVSGSLSGSDHRMRTLEMNELHIASAIIQKPFKPQVIIQQIRQILAK